MKLPNNVYNVLKWIAVIALPALGTFLAAVLPALKVDAETVNTVCIIVSATATFIGSLICVSTYTYNKTKDEEAA